MNEIDSSSAADFAEPEHEPDRRAEPVDLEQRPRLAFPVVGIGGSAGGLEAFTEFFKAMPADSGMAFVVIQHLPPDRESMIGEILQRHTSMKVEQVQDKMVVEPNHVYTIRPGHTLTIKDGRLHLGDRLDKPRHSRPVDDFFNSLADEQRERAIGIIMSGMGSNGTAGAQAIKAVGGLCVAQDPGSAQFPSMPRHLIDAGYSDFILSSAEIPDVLIAYARHPYVQDSRGSEAQDHDRGGAGGSQNGIRDRQHLREILAIIRTRTRFDFTGYKKPTVLRRIQRRMGLNRVTEIGPYARILRQSPVEVNALVDDLLIHVTGFFRDPQAWEALRERVIVPLVRDCGYDGAIRCWVTACSSGEEAYSLAMLLVEESERAGKPLNIKVFATDTAERTLSNARNGIYPGGIEAEMSPERLQRFVDKDDAVYRIRLDLRERVIFAPQNVLNDPPFSRLDIISCRNLLIYLEPEVQRRVLTLLHFGLREGGALFLGGSETVPTSAGLFEPIDKKARIYRRVGPTRHGMIDFPLPRGVLREVSEHPRAPMFQPAPAPSVAQLTTRTLIAHHIPVAVTVDRNFRIVYFQGDTKLYLNQPSGEPTQDLIAMANENLHGALRLALQRSMSTGTVQVVPGGWLPSAHGQRRRVVVTASPLTSAEPSDLFVVSFQEREEPEPPVVSAADGRTTADTRQSNEELQRVRDELQSAIEELQASTEEHRASVEEAMSVNEELQSSNEELETSKEEMQSLNEELSTVNAQLHAKIEEQQRTSGDLRSLLSSIDIAVIFLDSSLHIRRFTPMAKNLLDLIETDIGRPFNDLAKKFTDPDLLDEARSVVDRLVPVEREIRADTGRWYVRRVLPYRSADDHIEGVVITFIDITDRKRAQELATQADNIITGDLKAMNSLHAVSNLLMRATDLKGILEEVLTAAVELHVTDLGNVQLYDPGAQTLQITAQCGFSSDFLGSWEAVPLSDPTVPAARALRERTAIVIKEAQRELPTLPYREKLIAAGVRAMYATPLITRRDELLGVLTVYFRQPHRPDERSLRITDVLARQAADTIERMRIEKDLARLLRSEQLARRALDDAAQMKDQFLATLSHELRTPLSSILLWSRMLRGAHVSRDEIKEGLNAILSSAEAQSRLIEGLLDTSRIASGKLRLEMAQIDLEQVVRSTIEQDEPAAKAKHLHIESHLSPSVGMVIADPARLRQVVWNLLTNAVKFTPAGGRITVTLARQENDVVIRVSDTGAGIAADFLPHLFERFRQYDASITRQYGGLGLGLAISKQLVELHGGTIRAESAGIDQGATFTVTLPLPPVPGGAARAPAKAPPVGKVPLKDMTILLIEDSPETQRALGLVLRRAGAILSTAATGATAIEEYRKTPVQIILSDIGLPDFDGYALLGKIRAMETELKRPPALAVALTAYARDEDRQKAAAAGFRLHLGKPISADKLVATLAGLIRPA